MQRLDAMPANGTGKDAATGRFFPGHAGGPGRPRREVERQYLAALRDCVPITEWRKVVARALKDAKDGAAKAREWLVNYLMGKDPMAMLDALDLLAELEGRR
jgi:hypothetical protein